MFRRFRRISMASWITPAKDAPPPKKKKKKKKKVRQTGVSEEFETPRNHAQRTS